MESASSSRINGDGLLGGELRRHAERMEEGIRSGRGGEMVWAG